MARAKISTNNHGPAIRGSDPWAPSAGKMHQLLSEEERARLAVLASIVRFDKGEEIYREGQRADAVFNIISGVVKAYKTAPDRSEHITAFLFPDDMFGLSEEGRYANSIKAITPVAAYRFPVSTLRRRLAKDADLEFHVICKLIHELRETQRHAFLLARKRAISRVAMFLQLLENLRAARGERTAEIYLPMKRSDIGEYLGMSLEAVSRAFRSLTTRGIIRNRDRRHLKITDRSTFDRIVGDTTNAS
ncbi:transcriptional regulator, Crp/Fnr family [Bradyrhizobium canariense]|uniref:Transcriptional regulator, Crp/Fnr family n=2 Tax=Bradyrhizobium canariense TaxID=255045 RepID=A0A1H2BEV9_9BRAD|nr:transcriptional regulator, Crp/Fnr family [Bradyrhizobium canariense]